MGKNVFANGREISAKANNNKSVAAMPDVCLSPPPPPAGPVPIPYPNTSMATKTDKASKRVEIGGKPVGQKNSSVYGTSDGNQPATNNFGAGVVTHKLQGKTKHSAWSFDVRIEGANAIRHLDLTTHNHANPANGALTTDFGGMSQLAAADVDCDALEAGAEKTREQLAQDERKTSQDVGNGPTTITAAKYTPPGGPSGIMMACSRKLSVLQKNGFAQGLGRSNGKSEPSKVCNGYKYAKTELRPDTSHTESRIIEEIMAARGPTPGGTLVMAINWNTSSGVKNVPCPACETLICAAMKCDINIQLCKDGEPTKPKCD